MESLLWTIFHAHGLSLGKAEEKMHNMENLPLLVTGLVLNPCEGPLWEMRLERILQDTGGYSGLLLNKKILWTPSIDLTFYYNII